MLEDASPSPEGCMHKVLLPRLVATSHKFVIAQELRVDRLTNHVQLYTLKVCWRKPPAASRASSVLREVSFAKGIVARGTTLYASPSIALGAAGGFV